MKTCISKLAKKIFLGILFAKSATLMAQTPELPRVVPPGPETASFLKHVEHPVNLSAGIPEISLPIHTLQEGDISVPVSLAYNAGGIRVEEVASTVGLGWNLAAGGMISRTVKGSPDDTPGIGYMYDPLLVSHLISTSNIVQFFGNLCSNLNMMDYEPDEFLFSFPGHSGKLFYDRQAGKFEQMPLSNTKIEAIMNGYSIAGWVATDPSGTKYYFGKTDEPQPRYQTEIAGAASNISISNNGINEGPVLSNYITTWHLLKIVSLRGDAVDFYYQTSDPYYEISKIDESMIIKGSNDSEPSTFSSSYSRRRISHITLSSIRSETQEIVFEKDIAERLDLEKSSALKSITIRHKGATVKKFMLNHEYFVSNDTRFRWQLGNPAVMRHRLKLKSVQEFGSGNLALPPYEFTYNETILPNRTSYAQDAWGYYNGKAENASLVPKTAHPYSVNSATTVGTADRNIDEQLSKAAILEKIRFPTGGTVEYEYELNRPGLIVNKSSNADFSPEVQMTTGLFPEDPGLSDPVNNGVLLQDRYARHFTVNSPFATLKIATIVEGCIGNTLASSGCHFTIRLKGGSGNESYGVTTISNSDISLRVPKGNYIVEATRQFYPLSTMGFFVAIAWSEKMYDEAISGGLRIKEIRTSPDASSQKIVSKYSYSNFGGTSSSGYSVNYPIHLEKTYRSEFSFKVSSTSQAPMLSYGSSFITYRNVTEFQTDHQGNPNGKTEYTFSINQDTDPEIFTNLPEINKITVKNSNVFQQWQYGKLLVKQTFGIGNTGYYSLLRSETNNYESSQKKIINDFGARIEVRNPNYIANYCLLKFLFYSATTEYYRLKSSTVTDYFPSGNIITVTDNAYDENPLQPSRITTAATGTENLETRHFYPKAGFAAGSLPGGSITAAQAEAVATMAAQNNIDTPVQTQQFRNGSLLGTKRTLFRDWDPGTGKMILPETVQTSKSEGVPEDRIRYLRVDPANGNPLEVKQEHGMAVSYIWGYDKKYPVTKLENIAYADIPAGLITAIQQATDAPNSTEAQVLLALQALRGSTDINMKKAMITTYTYRPLVGVTSITDPKGYRTTYEYDTFGRLEFVKDDQGNILTHNQYHYKL